MWPESGKEPKRRVAVRSARVLEVFGAVRRGPVFRQRDVATSAATLVVDVIEVQRLFSTQSYGGFTGQEQCYELNDEVYICQVGIAGLCRALMGFYDRPWPSAEMTT